MVPPRPVRPPAAAAAAVLGPSFRSLARSLQTGVVLVDGDGLPLYANDAAAELLGLSAPADSEEGLAFLREHLPEEFRKPCSSHGRDALELAVSSPRGEHELLVRAIPVEGEDGGGLLLIEDRNRLAAMQSALLLASRMRSHSVLRSEVHDLKAPLNALSLNLQVLRRCLAESDDAREEQNATVELLQTEVVRLSRALDSFLQRTGSETPRPSDPRRLDVGRLVREMARLVLPSAEACGVRLEALVPETLPAVRADEDRLKQALLNVVLNALEAQPDGGGIRVAAERDENRVYLRVEDDGPGIPERLQHRVFEMNFTTKPDGTGIGLTVARSLLESQGGQLLLESREGRGTTVTLQLPAAG